MIRRRLVVVSSVALTVVACGGGNSPTSPSTTPSSNQPSVLQGTLALAPFELGVVNFSVDRAGTVTTRVDWNGAANDMEMPATPSKLWNACRRAMAGK